jgi:hypothetical protein
MDILQARHYFTFLWCWAELQALCLVDKHSIPGATHLAQLIAFLFFPSLFFLSFFYGTGD